MQIRPLAHNGITLDEMRQSAMRAVGNLVLVRDDPKLRFPSICPNCEAPAVAVLRIRRSFRYHVTQYDDASNETMLDIDEFAVPFCDTCVMRHRQAQKPPSPWMALQRIFSEANGFAGLVAVGIAIYILASELGRFNVAVLVIIGLPLLTGGWLLRRTWKRSRDMSVPRPTEIELAVDFTPCIAAAFEPAWRAFQFRSAEYANRFRQANGPILWNPQSTEAQAAAASRKRNSFRSNLVVGAIVAAVLLWQFWQYVSGR